MIEIIPFNKDVFDNINLEKKKLTRYVYINDINIVSNILSYNLPIQNKRIALKNILDFLNWVDVKININRNTIIPISSNTLIEFFNRDNYKEYMSILKSMNILTDVPYEDGSFYTKGSLYKQYRVHNDYINKEDLAIIVLEEDRSKDKFNNEVNDLDERYIKTIKNIEIDIKSAITSEIEHYKKNNLSVSNLRNRISRILYTKRKRFIKKGNKVDRIYHSFSNVSKVARKHLSIKMYDIDIKNCQPLLLIALLKEMKLEYDDNYQYDCEAGNFYENFITNELTRDDVKEELYRTVFFNFNENRKINKKFNEIYPKTWNSLKDIKDMNKSLACELQNIESKLFNNLIPKKSKHYFTLFDAIYFDNLNDVTELNNKIRNYFNEKEIKVQTEIGIN